jgi:lipid-A-disaccharide synthase
VRGIFLGTDGPTVLVRRMAGGVYVLAGELSGDAHGAGMIRALKAARPGLVVAGAGGPAMRAAGGDAVRDWVEDSAVVGVWEVLKRYGWFKRRFAEMLEEVRVMRPQVLVLVDYPGYNLRFAGAVRREMPEIRLVYYISPQVWAWHKSRIPKMAALLDEMLCLFPFEKPIFESAGLRTTFVGHPLVDELEDERIAGVRAEHLVGLFPGSREREVARLFPVMLETAKTLRAGRPGLRFEAPAASPRLAETMRSMVRAKSLDGVVLVTDGGSHALMQRATCAVIASGTATLEAAYFGLPYCLVYKVAWPTFFLGRLLVKLESIGLVNILAGERVVEEYLQTEVTPGRLARALGKFLSEPETRAETRQKLLATAAKLGGPGTHQRVAEAVLRWME